MKTNINDKIDSNFFCNLHATFTSREKLKKIMHFLGDIIEFSHRLYEQTES